MCIYVTVIISATEWWETTEYFLSIKNIFKLVFLASQIFNCALQQSAIQR